MPILSRGGGATSSSDIGDLDAPAWKTGGPTSGSGAWGTVGQGTEESLMLSYSASTGTAGFVSLQCTGDTDSFQLTEVEGEDIGTPQTFSALTNDHDLMYIAFKGTLAAGTRSVSVKVLPIYTDGSAKSMTISAVDHEGNPVGSVTATATVTGIFEATSIADFTDIYAFDGSSGTAHMSFGTVGSQTGLHQSLGGSFTGGWSGGKGGYCRADREIINGNDGFIEITPTTANTHMLMGLCYKSDFTSAGMQNTTASVDVRLCHRWAYYNWAYDIAAGDWVNTPQVVFTPGSHGTGVQNQAGRSIRISWSSNTVKLQYSDDAWATPVDVHTFADAIDTATNGNLYACFSTYFASNGVFESIRIKGDFL